MVVFAVGQTGTTMRLEVVWRSGRRTTLEDIKPNRVIEIHETASSSPAPAPALPGKKTWFEDLSGRLNALHVDTLFDDFERQPLLPWKLSQGGPGLAWFDVNKDGFQDLLVGGGRGGTLGIYLGDGQGEFVSVPTPVLVRDQTTLLAAPRPSGELAVYAGTSNYEDGRRDGAAIREYDFSTGDINAILPAMESSPGPLAMADVNGDGRLDLFVGGRVRPGRWPQAASSALFLGQDSGFAPAAEVDRLLQDVGLVSGALFADLESDGWPDLVLACEWGPIRVLANREGRFSDATAALQLDAVTGWWNSVVAADLDGDGQTDLVAGNWGQNSAYKVPPDRPLPFFYADFDSDGRLEVIETEWDHARKAVVPSRMRAPLSSALPYLMEPFPTHQAYSEASIEEFLGEFMALTSQVTVQTLATTVFFRRGDRFEAAVLPAEAQWAPVFGIAVADFDGDGLDDLFLAQNFFATRPDLARLDAGRGLLLRNIGQGAFEPVSGQVTGLIMYGEQRGAAVADLDNDGRVDLAVGQNAALTRVYRNLKAEPGLRIRVEGSQQNPYGVGTRLRWVPLDGPSQSREIRLGHGYWSQDSLVPVLGTAGTAGHLEVTFPGGARHRYDVPASATTGIVSPSGQVKWLPERRP
jgi:hypothetical protein